MTASPTITCGTSPRPFFDFGYRAIPPADIDHNGPDAARDGDLRPHAVRPEPVDESVFERPGRGCPEAHPGSDGARHGRDVDLVALDVDSDFLQHPLEAVVDPGRGTDLLAFDGSEITAPVALIGPHDQKPVHALSERAEQLRPLPCGKCGEHCVCGPADEVDLAVA